MIDQNYSPLLSQILGEPTKHKAFISFHHEDQAYRNAFDTLYGEHFISKSVDFGDIDSDNNNEYIKRLIQEEHISDSSIVIILYGANTWKRKHIDWEIYAALDKKVGGYSGLMIMVLPNFPIRPFNAFGEYEESLLYPYLHPRTTANLKSGYVSVYFWPQLYPNLQTVQMADAFQTAYDRRITHKHLIDNSKPQYQYNR